MVSVERTMTEPPEEQGNAGRTILWVALAGLGLTFSTGALVGVIAAATEDGGALGARAIAVLAALVMLIVVLVATIARLLRGMRRETAAITRRERLNRNILLGSGLLGAVIGATLVLNDGFDPERVASAPFAVFTASPLPVTLALLLAFVWAVVMPVVAWFWHARAIDEQEASAYRDGGYYAAYVYLVAAPPHGGCCGAAACCPSPMASRSSSSSPRSGR